MCDATFAFGQRGSHLLQCPSRKETARLPVKLASILSSTQLDQIHHVALGFEDSFLITWCDRDGHDRIDSHSLPQELNEFLYARNNQKRLVRDVPNIRCALGPYNSSFFAHDRSTYRWMDLPTDLLAALESRIANGEWTDRPRVVTLGTNSSFVLITEKDAAVWSLSNYQTLSKLLEKARQQVRGISKIHGISLHAYRYDCFVHLSRNGTILHNGLPPHVLPSIQAMLDPVLQDSKDTWPLSNTGKESEKREVLPRRTSNLQQKAIFRRDWGEHTQKYTAQTKGVKLSLSLSVSAAGIMKLGLLGK